MTKLKGAVKGAYYDLYVMLDSYSRYVVHWEVHARESAELAEQFVASAVRANGGQAPAHVPTTADARTVRHVSSGSAGGAGAERVVGHTFRAGVGHAGRLRTRS
ncbi:hypothetical protein [Nonomuraea sp. NPDC005650]|uniref:DDE-type integrase/transposase/recombinase n=1 Tax=Nonomuraea sp. NPDC005650 TaxID=3157045 RepID=UPI0033A2D75D